LSGGFGREKLEEILKGRDDEDRIKTLSFKHTAIGSLGLKVVLGCALAGLEELELSSFKIDETGIEKLSKNSNRPNLRKLHLSENSLGDKCIKICPVFEKRLKSTDEIVKNLSCVKLEEVNLSKNVVTDMGAILLGSSENWKNLK
jgi:Leucine-rich repeat (LRR) protein